MILCAVAFVSNVPDRRYRGDTDIRRCPSLFSSMDSLDYDRFDTLLNLEIHNGTCHERLWGFIPRNRPIRKPSSHVRVLKNPLNGNVDVSAFHPSDNNYEQSFRINAARDEGNITISFVAEWGFENEVGLSCDAIEVKATSGLLRRFSDPNGGKYSSQIDNSSDTVAVFRLSNNERLTYNKGDILLEFTLNPMYDMSNKSYEH